MSYSFNLGITSLLAGTGTAGYGCYQYIKAEQNPKQDESKKEKREALKTLALGTATAVLGIGLLGASTYLASALPEQGGDVPNNPPKTEEPAPKEIPLLAKCSVQELENLLAQAGNDSKTAQVFKVFNETQGISSENCLPWDDKYLGRTGYIDRIRPEHLDKAAMWGVDRYSRPFVATKYSCNQTQEGSVAFFQRYTKIFDTWVPGGHAQVKGCDLGLLDPIYTKTPDFVGNVTTLLTGGDIHTKSWQGGNNYNANVINLSK